ncbi:short chain isoprenyl diphosphate synthase IdsA [Methanobrevibacter sp.]|uniref:short chain isoprenyl diphosphate synthase IdsA n=1 Tax=Methanobrevibacter sp. TaxID=66852 RepID=UPI0038900136
MSDVKEVLGSYSPDIIKTIEEELGVITPDNLQEASIYLTKAGGKMLRPALSLITAEAVGGQKENALKAGSAIELIHTFSLIHDDIMDQDDMRRGMPSVHKVWGDDVAILAGDTLFSKAFEIIINSNQELTSPAQINNALATVADACVKICEGQALDMGFEDRFDVTEDEYMEMIFKKTGALIAAATKVGAIMGGASDEVIDAMYEYGRLIGLAFQIQDDYLDIASDEETLGKPIGSDIGKGKMTIIAINGLASAGEDAEKLLEILKDDNNSQDDIDLAIEILTKCGAIEYARNLALDSVGQAKEVLEILPDSSSKQVLADIADFVLERQS